MIVVINAPGTKACLSEVVYAIGFALHSCDNRDPSALMWGVTPWYCFPALFVLWGRFYIGWDTEVEPGVWWLTFYPSPSNTPVGYFQASQDVWKFIF